MHSKSKNKSFPGYFSNSEGTICMLFSTPRQDPLNFSLFHTWIFIKTSQNYRIFAAVLSFFKVFQVERETPQNFLFTK